MKIQFNTDNNIPGRERITQPLSELIEKDLNRFARQITRIEAHLSDVNGDKNTHNDIHCVLEARLEGLKPVAVNHNADTHEQAVRGALKKLESSLDSLLGKLQKH